MRNMDHYLSLNYHKRLYQDEDGDWIVEVDDLPGCIADGKTPDEAVDNLRRAMTSWIGSRIDAGLEVPEPSVVEEYSGKILVRMPRFLHRRLSLQAKTEGVSLNQYLVSLLVDASRANFVGKTFVQNVASPPVRCSWENTPGAYATYVVGFRDQNLLWGSNCWNAQGISYAQGVSILVGQAVPKQLTGLQTVAFPTATENA